MKICLVGGNSVQEFPVINYGGVESSVENLAWGFYNHNLDFFVITSNRKKKSDFPFEVRENGHEPLSFTNETQPEYYSGTRKVLDDLPQNETPDVIFCQSHEAAKSLLGYRNSLIIATFQDSCPKQPGWMDKNERLFFRFLSKAQFNNWVIEDWEREKSVQIYTGLTDENYYFSPSEKENYFLWVGAVGMNKGLDWFIYLASRNNNDKFISYGTASNEVLNEIKKAEEMVKNFEFRGPLARGPEHTKVFHNAKALIMPTQLQYEAQGRVNIEALSKGTPVIGTKLGALPELVKHHGYLTNDLISMEMYIQELPEFDNKSIFEYSLKFHVTEEVKQLINFAKKYV